MLNGTPLITWQDFTSRIPCGDGTIRWMSSAAPDWWSKYDLYQRLPCRKLVIKDGYYRKVLRNKTLIRRGSLECHVPGAQEDPVLRYVEYYEKKNIRPDKIRHLHYIQQHYPQVADSHQELLKEPDIALVDSRYDSFIVWGPGISYVDGILKGVASNPDFRILLCRKYDPASLRNFIKAVYRLDTTPMKHIRSKTRYLVHPSHPSTLFFILFLNRNLKRKMYNQNKAYEVCKCENVEKLKWNLRAQYNPRHPNRNYSISKRLPPGIKYEHVLHAMDREEETRFIMRHLGLRFPEFYDADPGRSPEIPAFLRNRRTAAIMRVKIDELRVNLLEEGRVCIEDSPHFSYVGGDRKVYILYWGKHRGMRLKYDCSPYAFDLLIKNFDAEKYNDQQDRLILVSHDFVILDGAHRASILKHRGIETVKVALLSP